MFRSWTAAVVACGLTRRSNVANHPSGSLTSTLRSPILANSEILNRVRANLVTREASCWGTGKTGPSPPDLFTALGCLARPYRTHLRLPSHRMAFGNPRCTTSTVLPIENVLCAPVKVKVHVHQIWEIACCSPSRGSRGQFHFYRSSSGSQLSLVAKGHNGQCPNALFDLVAASGGLHRLGMEGRLEVVDQSPLHCSCANDPEVRLLFGLGWDDA